MACWHWKLISTGAVLKAVEAHGTHFHQHVGAKEARVHALDSLFSSDPLVNAVMAVGISTAITQAVLYSMPTLSGTAQAFLVAFAAGGMFGNIFLHLIPQASEAESPEKFGLLMAGAFMAFVAIDKLLKQILSKFGDAHTGHSHSHTHAHSHGAEPKDLDKKTIQQNSGNSMVSTENEVGLNSSQGADSKTIGLATILNVAADSLHNIADGFSLASAFQMNVSSGSRAFMVMCFHEMPHQFGDYALVVRNGATKRAGMVAQLVTGIGTLTGVLLSHVWVGGPFGNAGIMQSQLSLAEYIAPVTAGLFLYVATVGVLPEILEPTSIADTLVQFLGIGAGFGLMSHLS